MTPSEIKNQLESLGIRATKLRGQHFLIDTAVLRASIAAAELKKTDTVLEVGPGLGVLTAELLRAAGQVVAVEIDVAFANHLEALLGPRGLMLVRGDVREIDLAKVLPPKTKQYKLVANIPYNITSEVLEKFLLASAAPALLVLLVQHEVAERVCALPPRMNRLAVFVQFFGKPEVLRRVPAGAFWPAPKVESALLRIRCYPEEVLRQRRKEASQDLFFRLVRAGFSAPRKKMIGNLAALGYDRKELAAAFLKAHIDDAARAEAVSMEQWFGLVAVLRKQG